VAKATFKAKLQATSTGGGGHFVEVPDAVVQKLGGAGRIRVRVTFDGLAYRGSIVRYGGRVMIGVTKAVMAEAGASVGDTLNVVAENDDAPRDIEVPEDLARALRAAKLTKAWDALSFTRRKELATGVATAKRAETRERRVERAVAETAAKER
jgi:hypothetical protein